MLNYLKKFALEILPSVAATVIGAYIVNHYISRPATNVPVTAVAPAEVKKGAKPADDAASIPERGVTAKGISERAMMEKSASERPGEFKPAENKPAETASIAADARKRAPAPAPKAVAKLTPAPAASPAAPAEPASAAAAAEDHRDANDLARAAIERLRSTDGQARTQDVSRAADAPHLQEAPRIVAPTATASIRPLPPPITVAAPLAEGQSNGQGNGASDQAPYTASIRTDDPNRPTPPADIPPPPPAPPLDLRADATNLATRTNNMAQDVLAKTKSMFHALIPGNNATGQSSSASQFTD
ncbi:MAG: hypothetical protein JOZ74_11810 [Bradyrhizobium sp.]|nr:hypothetical protein [Bradyrhizobium sp.]